MKLEKFVWPGGYTLLFKFSQSNEILTLCHKCASEVDPSKEEFEDYKYLGSMIHWEGESLFCDDCGDEMSSEYGVPNNEESNKVS